jgi:DNA-directed RNA polymerase, mitochondrial
MLNTLPAPLERALERFEKQEERAVRDQSYGDTRVSLKIAQDHLETLTQAVKHHLHHPKHQQAKALCLVLRGLPAEKIALCLLQSALHVVAYERFARPARYVGEVLSRECWGAQLTSLNPNLARRLTERATRKYGRVEVRHGAIKKQALRMGYKISNWSNELCIIAGAWGLDLLTVALPQVFFWNVHPSGERFIDIRPEVVEHAQAFVAVSWASRPIYLPQFTPPIPWTGTHQGGPEDCRWIGSPLVRHCSKEQLASIKHAIKAGTMAPTLDGLNALQSVPWIINQRVLDVLRACRKHGIVVGGLPAELPKLPPDHPEHHERENYNRSQRADTFALENDLKTAEYLGTSRFFVPMNLDYRGRVYPMSPFAFIGSDRMRSLFLFADPQPIGEAGIYWLKVHLANRGEFNSIHKAPFSDRVAWVDANLDKIEATVCDPLKDNFWRQAEKPFQFLAASFELMAALRHGPGYVTGIPVSFDGSCSGIQHLTAMTRAPEASLVNLIPNAIPQDVYQTVGAQMLERVNGAHKGEDQQQREMAQTWLDYFQHPKAWSPRQVVKRNVMTYFYSSPQFGLSTQQEEDLMEKELKKKVREHIFDIHPFGDKHQQAQAARFMGAHVYRTIENIAPLPAQVMKFLRKIAGAHAHVSKPTRWVTPNGFPWINRYYEEYGQRINLWLHDRSVRLRYQTLIYEEGRKIDKTAARNGIAPNFVHALDAAHLLRVAAAAARAGITQTATVHDSFGCLPSQAGRFRQIIREEFIRLYRDHDVLRDILEQAKADLPPEEWHRLPPLPEYGSLDLEEIRHAEYAFA